MNDDMTLPEIGKKDEKSHLMSLFFQMSELHQQQSSMTWTTTPKERKFGVGK